MGYVLIHVDQHSALLPLDRLPNHEYRVPDYDANNTVKAHHKGSHQYLISKSILLADAVINLPKLKTHLKVGLTAAMKNLVGVNGDKAYLPHFRLGSPSEGGDGYPARNFWMYVKSRYQYQISHWPHPVRKIARPIGKLLIDTESRLRATGRAKQDLDLYSMSGGNWYGNDTTWRMVVDLNRALLYSDVQGQLHDTVQRRWLSIVDGLIAGEGNGPLSPSPRPLGYLVAGVNPVEVDAVCAQLIGLDWKKLALLSQGYPLIFNRHDLDEVHIEGNSDLNFTKLADIHPIPFRPPDGWRGYVEINDD
jgi:hypothetical protein